LCFKCDDKYFTGHKCTIKGIHILEEDELPDQVEFITEDPLPDLSKFSPTDTQGVITMCTASINTKHNTLKFKGHIGQLDIMAMVDSDSSHSFINPHIVQTLSIPTVISPCLTVMTASGNRLTFTPSLPLFIFHIATKYYYCRLESPPVN
jgi:hypothetical protein